MAIDRAQAIAVFYQYPFAVRSSGTSRISIAGRRDYSIESRLDRRPHRRPEINPVMSSRDIETFRVHGFAKSLGDKNIIKRPSENPFARWRNTLRVNHDSQLGLEIEKLLFEGLFLGLSGREQSPIIGFFIFRQFKQAILLGFIIFRQYLLNNETSSEAIKLLPLSFSL